MPICLTAKVSCGFHASHHRCFDWYFSCCDGPLPVGVGSTGARNRQRCLQSRCAKIVLPGHRLDKRRGETLVSVDPNYSMRWGSRSDLTLWRMIISLHRGAVRRFPSQKRHSLLAVWGILLALHECSMDVSTFDRYSVSLHHKMRRRDSFSGLTVLLGIQETISFRSHLLQIAPTLLLWGLLATSKSGCGM